MMSVSSGSAPTTRCATPAISARVTSACPAHTTGDSPMPVTPSSVSISTRTDCSAVVPWPLRRQLDR